MRIIRARKVPLDNGESAGVKVGLLVGTFRVVTAIAATTIEMLKFADWETWPLRFNATNNNSKTKSATLIRYRVKLGAGRQLVRVPI